MGSAAFAEAAPAADSLAPNGIKIGEGRLHPYLDIEGRIDSAAGMAPTTTGGFELSPELIAHFRGGLRFDLNTPSTLIAFNGNGEFVWYTGALSRGVLTSASRFQTDVGLAAAFNRDGAVEFQIGDQLLRSDRTSNANVGIGVISLFNSVYLAAPIHPGGRGLEFTPKVTWTIEFFDPQVAIDPATCALPSLSQVTRDQCLATVAQQANLRFNNYSNLNFGLNSKWRFLPKTAIVLDVGLDWRLYWLPSTTAVPATLLKAMAGLTGLITSKLSVVVMAGGGGDLYLGAATFIANAEVGWTPLENLRLRLGYVRTMQPVPVYGIYGDDRPYLGANMTFFRRLGIALGASFDWLTFYGAAAVAQPRADYLVSVDVSPSVIITSWFNVGASYILSVRGSTLPQNSLALGGTYVRHEGVLRLTFQY